MAPQAQNIDARPPSYCPFTGKVQFASKEAAQASRRRARQTGGDPVVRVYRCECDAWHTTSRGKRR